VGTQLEDVLALSEQRPDFSGVLDLRGRCGNRSTGTPCATERASPRFAKAYFALLDELEIVKP